MGLLDALGLRGNSSVSEPRQAEDGGLTTKDVCASGHHKPASPRPLFPAPRPQPKAAPVAVARPPFGPDPPLLPDSMIRVAGMSVADIDARIADEMLIAAEVRASVGQYFDAHRSAEAEINSSTKKMGALIGTPFEVLRAEIQAASRGSAHAKAADAQQAKVAHKTSSVLFELVEQSSRAAAQQLASLQTQLSVQEKLDKAADLRARAKEIEDECAILADAAEAITTVIGGDPKDKADLVNKVILALSAKLQGADGFIAEAEKIERDAKNQAADQLAKDISAARTHLAKLLETLPKANNAAGGAAEAYAQRRQEAFQSFDKKSKGRFRFADLELALSIASKPIIPLRQCERRLRDAVSQCETFQEWASRLGKSIAKECNKGHHKGSDAGSKPGWIAEHVARAFAAKAVEAKRIAQDRRTELGLLSADLYTRIGAVQARKASWLAFFDAAEEAFYTAKDPDH